MNVKLILIASSLAILSGVAFVNLWQENSKLKDQVTQLELQEEKTIENLALVSEQLAEERELRRAAQVSLIKLTEVPIHETQEELPPNISRVLSGFVRSIDGMHKGSDKTPQRYPQ